MPTQEERREATRARILDAAHRLLHDEGVSGTTTRAVLDAAGVSRGAMYHHFASHEDLLAAVYEREASGAIERAMTRVRPSGSPLADLEAACLAWLDEVAKPRVARVLVIEGPRALGLERCREIESEYSMGRMRAGLAAARDAQEIHVLSLDLALRVLNAALTEAAVSIVTARRKGQARRAAGEMVRQVLAGFATACRA